MPRAAAAAERRVVEADMAVVVRQILSRRKADGHSASYAELRDIVPDRIKLTKADRKKSKSRPNEEMWWQTIRNIKSHAREGFVFLPGGVIRLLMDGETAPRVKAKVKTKAKAKVKAKTKAKSKAKSKAKVRTKAKATKRTAVTPAEHKVAQPDNQSAQ